jgi:hypothetical protein
MGRGEAMTKLIGGKGRRRPGTHGDWVGKVASRTSGTDFEHVIDRIVRDVAHGRFERSLSGLTAVGALVTGAEIYFEHYRASFGDKWMWSPIALTPPVVAAGIAGVFSRKAAKTWLPITSGVFFANGMAGEYFHARGVGRKPGGWALPTYNVPMGPPIAAPGLMCLVGGMGLLAALLRREQ